MSRRPTPPVRKLRPNPDLNQLKRQARELLMAYRAQRPEAVAEVEAHHRTALPETFALHDAQFVLARSYGFESWPKLKAAVDGVTAARLHEAVRQGDLEAARALLARRPEIVDLGVDSELRALHLAVMQRDAAMVRLLLEAGADTRPGIYPNRGATGPRTIAEERGYDEILALIDAEEARRGARGPSDPEAAYRRLREAVETGSEETVVAALGQDASLAGLCSTEGITLLHQAAGRGALRVTTWLLDHGAEVNRKTGPAWWWREGRTPLEFAAWGCEGKPFDREKGAAMAALLLGRGAALTPLAAAALGRLDFLAGCPRDMLEGRGLLQAAVRWGRLDVVRWLLDAGVDPDERTRIGSLEEQISTAGGPLMEAVHTGQLEAARLLLERGADPNAQVFTAGSPTFAAYNGSRFVAGRREPDPAMVDLLVEHGGWIDAASVGYLRQVEIARRMLAGELDPQLGFGAFSGETAAEQILWSGASGRSPEIVRMALEQVDWAPGDPRWFWMLWRPLPGHEDLDEAEQAACCETFRLLLARCDPNVRAAEGQTMLHEAIARDHGVGLALATILLDAGARTDVRDHLLKSTPLGWACRWGRPEIVKLLLERGADPVEPDAEPWATPRAWAEKKRRAHILALLDAARQGLA